MFEFIVPQRPTPDPGCAGAVVASDVDAFADVLMAGFQGLADDQRIELIASLEVLKNVAAGAQAALSADFDRSQRALAREAGVPPARQGRGVAHQIALARRVSPHRGQQLLSLATVLDSELPNTGEALRAGRISEWRASIVARETACLNRDDRVRIDSELAEELPGLGDRQTQGRVFARTVQLDAAAVVKRRRRAESERFVSIRPAPDSMCYLTGLLPVAQGVAAYAALTRSASTVTGEGDPRSRGQIMADTLVTRITGQATAEAVPVAVNLVMTAEQLLGDGEGAASIDGGGVGVDADLARQIIRAAVTRGERTWVRRLFTAPSTGDLVAVESTARCFPEGLARLIKIRDQVCRTPWCEAPIRHIDHAQSVADGGETFLINSQGLCESCNYAKQAEGWSAIALAGPTHIVETTTPTGHRYRSHAPPIGLPLAKPTMLEKGEVDHPSKRVDMTAHMTAWLESHGAAS